MNEIRELYYGFYKNLSYKNLIYVSFAELIYKNFGGFQDNRIRIQRKHHFTKNEIKILHKIYLNTNGEIFPSELENWYKEIKNYLIEKNYIKKYPIFGYHFTKLFKRNIKIQINNHFDSHIVEFINSGKIECLKPIIYNIEEVKIPVCNQNLDRAWTYYYYDKTEMNNEAVAHRHGIFNYLEKSDKVKYNGKK